jgi:hypothetical protein
MVFLKSKRGYIEEDELVCLAILLTVFDQRYKWLCIKLHISQPMQLHELAIMQIGRYLCNNPDGGIIYNIDRSKGLEVFADADFAGGWSVADSNNADNILSQTGFVICYANYPVIWCSKLQTEIALSTAEAEYIAMSHALRETI